MAYQTPAKHCPKCGHKTFKERADLRYCSHCGYSLRRIVEWRELTPDVQANMEKMIEARRKESYFIPKPRE